MRDIIRAYMIFHIVHYAPSKILDCPNLSCLHRLYISRAASIHSVSLLKAILLSYYEAKWERGIRTRENNHLSAAGFKFLPHTRRDFAKHIFIPVKSSEQPREGTGGF